MNKKIMMTMMLALVTTTGLAQTKTATVTGYSPALKDGTLVLAGIGTSGTVVDTVQAGHFAYTLPVEEFTESFLSFIGEGCPNSYTLIFLRPDVTVKVTGNDCLNPLWKVESPIPEQQTQNRLTEYCRDVLKEGMLMDLAKESREKRDSVTMKRMKQEMLKDIDGDHYYLTDEQFQYIMNKYESIGIPTYAIYNTKGEQTYKNIGFPGNEVIRKELETASK